MEIRFYDALPPEGRELRTRVFVDEQGFKNEFDETDGTAVHAVLFEGGAPVAVGRFFAGERAGEYVIGRVAVDKPFRGKGLGAETVGLIEREILLRGGVRTRLHAQVSAAGFYKKLGYAVTGGEELDEGCPHVWMEKRIVPDAGDITRRFDFAAETVGGFVDALASDAPAPGGGAAAALCGAQGAALVSMVCELTLGNGRYAEFFDICREAGRRARALSERFLELARLDAEVFYGYSLAAKLPRETEAQRSYRDRERANALRMCAEAPLMTLGAALDGLLLCEGLVGKSNRGLASDLFSAACCLAACGETAAENVRVNLRYIKDEEFALDAEKRTQAVLGEAIAVSERIKGATRTGPVT